jgi:hypothetical protein
MGMAERIPGSLGRMYWSGYDTAQICANGHVTNSVMQANPSHSRDFCSKCGAKTLSKCPECNCLIRGQYHSQRVRSNYSLPAFCEKCGAPFPWTKVRVEAAKALASELEELSVDDRLILAASIDDIIAETPRTELAAVRIKRIIRAAPGAAAETIRKLAIDVASDAAKKALLGI